MNRRPLIRRSFIAGLAAAAALLFLPDPEPAIPLISPTREVRPFVWNQDAFWDSLETSFVRSRRLGCDGVTPIADAAMRELRLRLGLLHAKQFAPNAAIYAEIEQCIFLLGPWVAVCPDLLPAYLGLIAETRSTVKRQSVRWNIGERTSRETLYRLLYGGRMAAEEVILQVPEPAPLSPLIAGIDEPSATPSALLLGVRVHSGDVLVSRGGAPTSALIARGSDFPGSFSHIALVHVDPQTKALKIIESHIERGVVASSPEEYLKDTKLRVMVLRMRADHPAITADPQLPHKAASIALSGATAGHIAYDFAMDFHSSERLFCSEVASDAYQKFGVTLWMGLSHITSPGLRRWLADFGVRYFETQEPSDLEYDPQMVVVAEWRDLETLRKDHQDNAATEVMLEGAERGDRMEYNRLLLPVARLVKAYSAALNTFGIVGPIPEGMTATSALKHRWYTKRHEAIVHGMRRESEEFRRKKGFSPPYWDLLRSGRRAEENLRNDPSQ